MKSVSIIVPVYNVENYLEDCLESLIKQSYKYIQIILVDDGSTDNSSMICDYYSNSYQNIEVIHKENRGLSDARNIGLSFAKGDYICFVDSDDLYAPNIIEKLVFMLDTTSADIGLFKYTRNSHKIAEVIIDKNIMKIDRNDCLKRIFYQKDQDLFSVSTNTKIYRKEIIKTIQFPVGRYNEDLAVVYDIFKRANVICYTTDIGYFYRLTENSITTRGLTKNQYDSYLFSKQILFTVEKEANELIYSVRSMKFRRALQMFRKIIIAKDEIFLEDLDIFWKGICEERKYIIVDPLSPISNKLCACISFLGKTVFTYIMESIS